MNNKAFTISIGLAFLAAYMIYQYVSSMEATIKGKYGVPTSVLVAKKNIGELNVIHENMLELVTKPKEFVDVNAAKTKDEIVGLIAAVPISKGEQITLSKVVEPGIKTGLSKQVSPGKRAVAINVNDENAVNRLVKPGDRVDIVATIDPPGAARGSQIAKIILQDVPVLAVGEYIASQAPRKVEKDEVTGKDTIKNLNIDRSFHTVTVEVDPQAALQITLLRDTQARVGILLRNNDDSERVSVNGTTLLDVIGGDVNRIRVPAAQR